MNHAAAGCVLFDLDGTLLDTAPDMLVALNQIRRARNLEALPLSAIRHTVSQGSPGMLKAAFGLSPDDSLYEEINPHFLALYREAIAVETSFFPGISEILTHLERENIRWGIVTNKPAWLTEPLLRAMGLWSRAGCVVSGDTLNTRKPDPQPLLYACEQVGADPEYSLYVGDAERDIQAGNRAGMVTLVAGFGYLGVEDQPQEWNAHGFLEQPTALLGWLDITRSAMLTTDR